jgi:hypothetical protein
MTQAVKADKASGPLDITVFGTAGVLTNAASVAESVEQAGRLGARQFADRQAENVLVEKGKGRVSLFQGVQGVLFGVGDVFEESADVAGRQVAGMAFVVKENETACPVRVAFCRPLLAEARAGDLADEIEESRRCGRCRHEVAPKRGNRVLEGKCTAG